MPHYIFPHTYNAPAFIQKCQACNIPSQRAIIAPTGEILFTVTTQSIDQMMQAPSVEKKYPFLLRSSQLTIPKD